MAETTSSNKTLHITVVTPEKAVLDEMADLVILPLFDGELGVLPGRAAFVGQLGPGELRIKNGALTKQLFVDGGFVQVRANGINVLTPAAKKPEEITESLVNAETTRVEAMPATNAIEKAAKVRAQGRVKGMVKVKSKFASSK